MKVEGDTYFQALYFCYVSLLTIGYGDLAPRSNVGKPFFVVWSLCAIPTMTILISSMGDTIVAAYKQGTFSLADLTILPKRGYIRNLFDKYPRAFGWLEHLMERRREKSRLEKGFPVGPDPENETTEEPGCGLTLEDLADEETMDEHDLANNLTAAIRATADDLKHGHFRHYAYEEWVVFVRLIRFTKYRDSRKHSVTQQLDEEESYEGIIEWDWIGEDSPMMADQSETEWVLDRLCESLERYMHKQVPELKKKRRRSGDARISGTYHRRSSRQASDVGFHSVPVTGVEGPRRRANSAVRSNNEPDRVSSPISSSLRPGLVPGPGARTPPTPGVSPHRQPGHVRFRPTDGGNSETDSDSNKFYECDITDLEKDGALPCPLKPRPRDINTSSGQDIAGSTFPFSPPPIPDLDNEREGAREGRRASDRPGRPSLANAGSVSSSRKGSSTNASRNNSASNGVPGWWRRRDALGGPVVGKSTGSVPRRRAPSAGGGMQSLTAMRLKRS